MENELYHLINSVFTEFIGHEYSDEGRKTFDDFIRPEKILERHKKGNLLLTYEDNHKIVGLIELRDNNHICLFFVDKQYHNRGIGKNLLNEALNQIKDKTRSIDVNASPYSENIYAKLGFKKIHDVKVKNGIRFIPMKLYL